MRVQCVVRKRPSGAKNKSHKKVEQLTCAHRGHARKRGRTPGAYNADEKQQNIGKGNRQKNNVNSNTNACALQAPTTTRTTEQRSPDAIAQQQSQCTLEARSAEGHATKSDKTGVDKRQNTDTQHIPRKVVIEGWKVGQAKGD